MAFADLKDDGDYKLLTTDYKQNQLKIFMGTNVLYSIKLKGKPTSLVTFYNSNAKPSKSSLMILLTYDSDSSNCNCCRELDIFLQRFQPFNAF